MNPMEERIQTERWREIERYLEGADDRERSADRRSADLVKVHRDGWRLLADAVGKGLGEIAKAIRDHDRR